MKRYIYYVLVVISFILCGCNNSLSISYPDDPVKFQTYNYNNPDNTEDTYRAFDYKDRTYIPYSSLGKSISKEDVDICLGCIVQNEEEVNEWVVKLKFFENDDYLMVYYPNAGMQSPVFYRAIDTKGKVMDIPAFISNECYEFWQ